MTSILGKRKQSFPNSRRFFFVCFEKKVVTCLPRQWLQLVEATQDEHKAISGPPNLFVRGYFKRINSFLVWDLNLLVTVSSRQCLDMTVCKIEMAENAVLLNTI